VDRAHPRAREGTPLACFVGKVTGSWTTTDPVRIHPGGVPARGIQVSSLGQLSIVKRKPDSQTSESGSNFFHRDPNQARGNENKQFMCPEISNSDTATCWGACQQVAGRKGSPRIANHQVRISARGEVNGELCALKGDPDQPPTLRGLGSHNRHRWLRRRRGRPSARRSTRGQAAVGGKRGS